jgi:hypothetical protein
MGVGSETCSIALLGLTLCATALFYWIYLPEPKQYVRHYLVTVLYDGMDGRRIHKSEVVWCTNNNGCFTEETANEMFKWVNGKYSTNACLVGVVPLEELK